MPEHPIFADDMWEIVESFVVETREILEAIDRDLLQLEQHPGDEALIDNIFRAVHTIKGTSGFLSLEQLSVLAHHFEDVLNRLRRGTLAFHARMMDVMLAAVDQMKVLVQQVVDQRLQPLDLSALLADLQAISGGTFAPEPLRPAPADAPAPGTPVAEAGEARRRPDRTAETIRVDVGRLDNLMDLVGELVLGRNRLLQIISDLGGNPDADDLHRQLADASAQVDFITTELQSAIMRTRMVQIGHVFNKFPRLVRDLAREFDKQIELEVEGEEAELDRSLIEEISDPLVHLIRNAADHGIERPEDRLAHGKPAPGRIRLSAAHEGNHIVIVVEDDGAGMDPEALRRRAVEKDLLSPREAADMSPNEAFALIFRPGFSTARQVSQVSGRGVGMDVVKTNITRLNGTVSIDSTPGRGTRFTLKLPLTLAVIQSLLVRVAEETFAVPLHAVVEVVSLNDDAISTIRGRAVIRLRDQVVPLIHVASALELPGTRTGRAYAVIVGVAHHRLGLVVDDLAGHKEIVIKPLGAYLEKIPGLAGSTILGDGRVILILDVGELARLEHEKLKAGHTETFAPFS